MIDIVLEPEPHQAMTITIGGDHGDYQFITLGTEGFFMGDPDSWTSEPFLCSEGVSDLHVH